MAVLRLPFAAVGTPTKAQIGAWLKRARLAAKKRAPREARKEYAQAAIAHRVGVRDRAVRMWEKGRTAPPAHQFFELVAFYDADLNELLGSTSIRLLSDAEWRKLAGEEPRSGDESGEGEGG